MDFLWFFIFYGFFVSTCVRLSTLFPLANWLGDW